MALSDEIARLQDLRERGTLDKEFERMPHKRLGGKIFNITRREMLGTVLVASSGVLSRQAAADEPPMPAVSPEETRLRAFIAGNVVFERFVFAGNAFPVCRFEPPQAARNYLDAYELKTIFYDAQGKAVPVPIHPGPYAAIVNIVPAQGRPSWRLVTLYKLAKEIPDNWRFTEGRRSEVAEFTNLPVEAVTQQFELIAATCKDREWNALSHDPRFARLLAGLHNVLPEVKRQQRMQVLLAPRKNVDAFAAERQWWVGLKRKIYGTDKKYGAARMGPDAMRNGAAPVVRSGSLMEAGFKPDAAEKIDVALQGWAGDTDQAFAVCVVRHGVIAFHKAYGMRDGKPMTTETKSWMASITKPMCATLMMMLVDKGIVGLDDPIEKYLPQLNNIRVETPITIRHLYTHTSGLDKWPGWNDESPDVENQLADCCPFVRVGKTWAYGGQGNTIGAKIIETVSGEALPVAYLRHLHGPLGNAHTDVIGAHADAYSIPLDIARFGQMLLNRGAYGNLRFLRPETFAQMLPQKLTQTLGPDATKIFGIGLDGSAVSFGHGAASAATFHIETDRDLVVVMTRNSIGANYDKYNGKFWQAINDSIA